MFEILAFVLQCFCVTTASKGQAFTVKRSKVYESAGMELFAFLFILHGDLSSEMILDRTAQMRL